MIKPDDARSETLPAAPGAPEAEEVRIERGICYVLYAYDVGLAINLDEAQRRSRLSAQRGSLRPKRRETRGAPTIEIYQYNPSDTPPEKLVTEVHCRWNSTAVAADLPVGRYRGDS